MKNNQDKEFKRWLKNKISVTQALMIQFLITGSLSMFGLAAMSLGSNVAYADLNQAGTGANNSVAIGQGSSATNPQGVAVGYNANAGGNNSSIAIGNSAQATGNDGSLAIGRETKASGSNGVAIGRKSKAIGGESVAIGLEANSEGLRNIAIGNNSITRNNDTIALGTNSKATGESAVAFGRATSANGNRAMAFGNEAQSTHNDSIAIGSGSKANAHDTIAFGNSSVAKKEKDIIIGKEAKSHDAGSGYSIAIGTGAISGSTKVGIETNSMTTGKKGDAGGVAIGTGAYIGVNRDSATPMNSSVAIGSGAGTGFRALDANKIPVGNGTDADDNAEVLRKAFGVNDINADYKAISDGTSGYTNVDINEGTAVGRHTRAIGDQAVAIGAQTIAGMGAIAIGGNDITQFANKKYYKSTKENFKVSETVDHTQSATLSEKTISQNYQALVGTALDTSYKATYAQDGSVVLGMQAHSGTPLGTAIGTNSLVRKGAFGATAIGAGSQIQANAEAAVAIGMGSVANGAYSLAAGTASWAEFGDVAIGYQAEARGKDGAIAIGRGTKAKGDSSIILGGANIDSASKQTTSYITDKLDSSNQPIIEHKNVNETISGEKVSRRYSFVKLENKSGTVAEAYKVLTGKDMVTAALDYSKNENKNGHASTTIGVHSLAKGDLSSAFGAGSRANAIGALALGTGAIAYSQNSVAIGTGSIAGDPEFKDAGYDLSAKSTANLNIMGTRQTSVSYDKDGNVVSDGDASKVAYKFSWAGGDHVTPGDIVSFGSPGSERQLKHVAAGRVSEDSTDAINGSQLNSIAKKVASGWNIAGDNKTKVSGIGTEDQVNFINGNGTTVTVENQAEVKNGTTVTTPKGANVKFDVKAKDGSITSNADGITVNTDGTTITKDADGKLKVNTGNITNNNGVPTVADADKNKIATAETVANAIKDSYWIASAEKDGTKKGTDDNVKAGTKVIFDAGKNIEIEHSIANKFTFKTVDTPEFKDITLNDGSATPNKVKLAPTTDGLKLSKGDNADSPAKITNVAAGTDEKDAVNYKQLQDALNSVSSSWKIEGSANGGTYNKDASTTSSEQIVSKDDKVGLKAGKNIVLDQSGKEFTYSLSKELTGLEKVEVKDDKGNTVVTLPEGTTVTDKDGNTSKLDGNGLTITPKDTTKKPVSITKDGINAGENSIKNVAGNLPGAKTGTNSPKTSAEAPTATELPNMVNNAATVGDVLNAGWNLQGNGVAKDFVKPYDTVNFVDGMNTRAVVTTDADGKVSNVQIDVKDLPIAYTNADGDKVVKGPDNKFYKESDLAGKVFDPKTNTFKNADGTELAAQPTEVAKNDIKTNLVNPNAEGNKTGDPTELGNVKSGLDTIKDANGGTTPTATDKAAGLVNLTNDKVSDNNAATVGDLRKMGWVVSADKTTDGTGEYSDQVKNANEVRFVGKGTAKVSGKTEGNVRTITVEVNDQVSTNNSVTPVVYTKADGTQVYPIKQADGTTKFNTKPDGTGEEVDKGDVITSVNGPDGTKKPTALKNIAGNLEGAKTGTNSPKTSAEAPTATELPNMVNNAATVGDVLNAGWNLQGNGVAKDFVKPYDTVNFVDGMNTRAVVTTDADGKVSNVQIDVKDLPIAYTNADGDKVVKGPDNKFYKESDLADKVYDPATKMFKNANGTPLAAQPAEVAKDDIKTNLVNPNAEGNKAGDPTELGNIKSGLDTIKEADNKAAAGLVNLEEKDPQTNKPKVSDNNAATVGDLRKMGWVVSADKTTGDTTKPYNDQVKNSNEVKFVGKNGIEVTGKTDDKGVRTLTFELKTGEITPTEIVKPDGTKLIKIGDKVYNPTDIDKDGNPKQGVNPVGTIASDGKVYEDKDLTDGKPNTNAQPVAEVKVNEGAKFVTGNQVADAIEQSGFNIGKVESKSAPKDSEYDNRTEKVNPNDNVQFADGRNTNVKLVTKDRLDPLGKVVTTTTVKVDVEGLPITYTNKDGKPIVKKGDKFYLLDDKGNATDTEVKVEDIKTNLVAPNSKANEIGAPQSLGNVASGLKAADIKTDANKSDDKKVVEALIKTPENDAKLNTGANLDDLKTLSKAGLDFGANVGDDVHRNLGEKLSILGNDKVSKEDANNETKFSSKNVVTTTVKDSVNIKFSQNPEFDSIKIGNRENKPVVTISSEGIDAGNTKITNVAPGEISDTSQDAINGSQLSGVLKGINAGIASSVAMANLPQVSNIGMHRHNIAASVGVHRGESAFALGLSGLNHRGSLVYKASGALNTKGHVSFGIGIGYQFDRNTRDNDTHRNDIIDLKEKLEDVIRENAEYKQEIQEYRKEQVQNKAIIDQLMKRLEALEKNK